MPPTPTPIANLPPPPLEIPQIGVWEYAPDAVATWNMFRDQTPVLQVALLFLLLFLLVKTIMIIVARFQRGRDD